MQVEDEEQEGLDFEKNFKYSEDFESKSSSFFLMSVSPAILDELQKKKVLSIISQDAGDVAKLVSDTDTFKIKRYDYPNSYFLTEKISGAGSSSALGDYMIGATMKSVFQLEKQANQKDKLYKYLVENQVTDAVFEANEHVLTNGQSPSFLMNSFFMSKLNLNSFIEEIQCVRYQGELYFLEMEIFLRVIRSLLCDDPNAPLSTLNLGFEEAKSRIDWLQIEVFLKVMQMFGREIKPASEHVESVQDELKRFEITYEGVCRFILIELQQARKEYTMDDFADLLIKMMEIYTTGVLAAVPETDSEKQILLQKLRNRYFVMFDANSYQMPTGFDLKKITLAACDPYTDSFEPKERVSILYERKKTYFPLEFRDYLAVLNLQKKDQDDLVLSNCRVTSITIHKKNHEMFVSLYPAENLNPDKLNPENFSCRMYSFSKK